MHTWRKCTEQAERETSVTQLTDDRRDIRSLGFSIVRVPSGDHMQLLTTRYRPTGLELEYKRPLDTFNTEKLIMG